MWIKRVMYRGGHKDFPVKAHRNTSGLHIRDEPHAEVKRLILEKGYTGSSYICQSETAKGVDTHRT